MTVFEARTREVPVVVEADAELTSLSSPAIAAEVPGKVRQVFVRPGQEVTKGQPLVVLDDTDLALTESETRANVTQLQAQLAEKTRAAQRASELYAREYVSRSSLEAAMSEVSAAQAQVDAAQARALLAQRQRAKARVTAPFDGTVVKVSAVSGSYVRAGDVLLELWSPFGSTLRLRVPQERLWQVKPGQNVSFHWAGQQATSVVSRVSPAVSPVSRSFDVYVEVPLELAGASGLALRATLELEPRRQLMIPAQAPQLEGSQAYVVLAQEGKARRVPVQLGQQREGLVEVVSGLDEGAQVVVEGASFANDGQRLSVREPAR